ncbi:unnamed protein product [Brachionus calyciflorus]|uniref:Mitochondrial import inner membrane translocase subunit Tim21 n=1 Tax=Brachionus calyciflorus TaxID=104777 RepID=A0A813V0Q9_9BILA|nr:unnamed protein product [Brachionus calyciflorus]
MLIVSKKFFNRIFICKHHIQLYHSELFFSNKTSIITSLNNNKILFVNQEHLRQISNYSYNLQQKSVNHQENNKSVIESSFRDSNISTHVTGAKRAKQAAKDVGNGIILLGGAGLLVGIFYFLFSELFSRESPSGIYDESSKICLNNPKVQDALGHPIKVHAESGGRRVFQIKHKLYMDEGQIFLILNYYLEGPRNKGDVFVKCKKNDKTGKFEYEHIIVKLQYVHNGERKILVKHKEDTF